MKIEYDAAHDLLNIEFLANVPVDDSLEVDGVVIRLRKRQTHRRDWERGQERGQVCCWLLGREWI